MDDPVRGARVEVALVRGGDRTEVASNEGSENGVAAVGLDRDVVGMFEVFCDEGRQQGPGTTPESNDELGLE